MAQQGTGTPQDPIKTKLYFQKKGLVYEVGGGGGGGSSSATYIKTPVILSPVNEATGVSVLATIRVSEYENLFESDAWANRHVQIATVGEFTPESIVYDHMEMATEFQVTEPALPANTVCYVRAKDYSADGLESEWSNIVMFTTGEAITVNKPELQLFGWHESTTDFVQTVKATGSEFGVTQGQIDNHIKTDWWIEQATTRSNTHIWESIGDTSNLTSITTPEIEALQPSTKYVMCCVYYGERFGASPVAMKEFTTRTPTLTATAFSNTRGPDTHISTDWKIVLASDAGGAAVWESTSDVANLTTITVPKGKLQTDTSYIAMVRYRGQVYGVSEWAQYQFSTVAAFSSINTPSLTVAGAPSSVLETPTLTLSAFGGDNATHKNTHFKVLKNDDNSLVWETSVAAPAVSARVPAKTLQANTTYKFQGWYEAVEGVTSQVAEVVATTKDTFVVIGDIGKPNSPTFGVGIPSDEEAEAFISGMQKHPDFYDETKAGYGSWILPDKNLVDVVTAHGVLKYIPKFYWRPLFKGTGGSANTLSDSEIESLVPYVSVTKEQMIRVRNKYPYSGIVFASSSAFANEAEANAQGFILPAAFIDGGKEKNGFFIAPTLTEYQVNGSMADVFFGRTYPAAETTLLWRLGRTTDDLDDLYSSLRHNARDAIGVPRTYSHSLCCESAYTVAALAMISLCTAQYAQSSEDSAWYSSGTTNYPKGINKNNSDVDDNSVQIERAIDSTNSTTFPTTEEGYCKTTHNGRINGITHVNGWLRRPMVGTGVWGDNHRVFNCTKYSISQITAENMQVETTMHEALEFSLGGERTDWSEQTETPLYVDVSGHRRLFSFVYPCALGAPSTNFGKDYSSNVGTHARVCGGNWKDASNAGIFFRENTGDGLYGYGWDSSYNDWGFRVIGYSTLNSDGTTSPVGGGVVPEPTEPVKVYEDYINAYWETVTLSFYKTPQMEVRTEGEKEYIVFSDIDVLLDLSKSPVITSPGGNTGHGSFSICVQSSRDPDPPTIYPGVTTDYNEHPDLQIASEGDYLYRIKGSLIHEQTEPWDHIALSVKLRQYIAITGQAVDNFEGIFPMPD